MIRKLIVINLRMPGISQSTHESTISSQSKAPISDLQLKELMFLSKNPQNARLYITDFLIFQFMLTHQRMVFRFLKLLGLAQDDPDSYYYSYTQLPLVGVI